MNKSEKMHESGQGQLLQISNVQWDLQNKQWRPADCQQPAGERRQRSLYAEEHGEPLISCRQKRRKEEEKFFGSEKRHLDEGRVDKKKTADRGIDHLLILAHSAELLLESENVHCAYRNSDQSCEGSQLLQNQLANPHTTDQKHIEKQIDATQVDANVEAEKSTFLLQGSTRLSQLRRQARLKNNHSAQETNGQIIRGHVDCQTLEALVANCSSQEVKEVHEPLKHEVDHLCAAAERWAGPIEHRRKQPCLDELLQVNDGRPQPTMQCHISTQQSVLMTHALQEHRKWQRSASQLSTNEQREHPWLQPISTPQQEKFHELIKDQMGLIYVIEPQSQLQMPEVQKDQRFIARQRRLLRTFERRKQLWKKHCSAAKIQGHGHFIADEQRRQMLAAEGQWLLPMSVMQEREHRHMVARQRRAKRLKEQRRQHWKSHQPNEENHVDGGNPHLHVVSMAELNNLSLKVGCGLQVPVITRSHKELQLHEQLKVNVDVEKTFGKGRTRLTQLRCEARLRNRHLVERRHVSPLDYKSDDGTGTEQVQGEFGHQDIGVSLSRATRLSFECSFLPNINYIFKQADICGILCSEVVKCNKNLRSQELVESSSQFSFDGSDPLIVLVLYLHPSSSYFEYFVALMFTGTKQLLAPHC
ncbi:hypothetical protein HHK36_015347 [Tetracentron sinense]|uniref:Uncharacterized protein n=1 Tax=Tetracentron sinense TaxID=13715 RepID=A0A835DDS5_TETSI|nr:hypothetical protein HHK36_015347 [Tetracentron sinense]